VPEAGKPAVHVRKNAVKAIDEVIVWNDRSGLDFGHVGVVIAECRAKGGL